MKKITVIDKLKIDDSKAMIEEQGDEEMYSIQTNVNNKPCVVSILFYNDIFMGYQYQFEDTNITYEYAADLRKYLETVYGEPDTQPILSPDRKNFDSLDSYDDIKFSDIRMVYYENWDLEKDAEIETEMLGDLEIERLDITMQLISTPTNHVILITRYFAVRTLLQ